MFCMRKDAIKRHLRKLIWLSVVDQRAREQGGAGARPQGRPWEGEHVPVPGKGWQRVVAGTLRWRLGSAALAGHVPLLVTAASLRHGWPWESSQMEKDTHCLVSLPCGLENVFIFIF